MRLARNVIPQMLAEARSIVDVSSVVQRLWQTYGPPRDFLRGLRAALQQAVQKTGQLLLFAHAHFFREHSAHIFAHFRFPYSSGAPAVYAHALPPPFHA